MADERPDVRRDAALCLPGYSRLARRRCWVVVLVNDDRPLSGAAELSRHVGAIVVGVALNGIGCAHTYGSRYEDDRRSNGSASKAEVGEPDRA